MIRFFLSSLEVKLRLNDFKHLVKLKAWLYDFKLPILRLEVIKIENRTKIVFSIHSKSKTMA